jgi:hypothetical protein
LVIGELKFTGMTVSSVASALRIQPRISTATGCSINSLLLIGNSFRSTAQAAALLFNNGAAAISIGEIKSVGNTFDAVANDAFIAIGTPIGSHNSALDTYRSNRNFGPAAVFCGTDIKLVSPTFVGNTGGAGNSYSVTFDNTGRISVSNPTYSGVSFKAEITAATEYVESGWHSATPAIINGAGARLINFYGALGRATTYGTAAPTTGAWRVGDRVYNQSPAVGQPKSWVCTVAGTPGTWVSEGNL